MIFIIMCFPTYCAENNINWGEENNMIIGVVGASYSSVTQPFSKVCYRNNITEQKQISTSKQTILYILTPMI